MRHRAPSRVAPPDDTLFPGTNGTTVTRLVQSVGYSGTFSTIDNKLDPHNGNFFRLTQDFVLAQYQPGGAAPYVGTSVYMKTVADARAYHEFIRQSDIVGMFQVQGGNIFPISGTTGPVDNFFKGGETIRGFATYGIGPRTHRSGIAVGGKNLRRCHRGGAVPDTRCCRMTSACVARSLRTRARCLTRSLGPTAERLNDGPVIRASAGASILWASPFGLLRADFGWALAKAAYDQPQVFRFSAGQAF